MAKRYLILHGQQFRDSDNAMKGPGETIDLEDDVAARYKDNLQLVGEVIVTTTEDGHATDVQPVAGESRGD